MSFFISTLLKETGIVATFLLEEYPNAAAAYSLRALTSDAGPVVRVRRSSDNTEQDFSATDINDGSLETFCGSGDGFVTTWYDQSGNSNDATQTTTSEQPKIVSAGSLIVENGQPAIDFDGTTDYLTVTQLAAVNNTSFSAFNVSSPTIDNGIILSIGNAGSSREFTLLESIIVSQIGNGSGSQLQLSSSLTATGVSFLRSTHVSNGTASNYDNGSLSQSSQYTFSIFQSNVLYIGASEFDSVGSSTVREFGGKIQESVVYPSDQSSNRTAIEDNINFHYGIY